MNPSHQSQPSLHTHRQTHRFTHKHKYVHTLQPATSSATSVRNTLKSCSPGLSMSCICGPPTRWQRSDRGGLKAPQLLPCSNSPFFPLSHRHTDTDRQTHTLSRASECCNGFSSSNKSALYRDSLARAHPWRTAARKVRVCAPGESPPWTLGLRPEAEGRRQGLSMRWVMLHWGPCTVREGSPTPVFVAKWT